VLNRRKRARLPLVLGPSATTVWRFSERQSSRGGGCRSGFIMDGIVHKTTTDFFETLALLRDAQPAGIISGAR
jgi:hypothetical protein